MNTNPISLTHSDAKLRILVDLELLKGLQESSH